MRKIEVKKEKFLSTCITMLMGLDKLEICTQTLLMIEIIKNCEPEGMLIRINKRKIIADTLHIKQNHLDILFQRLQLSGHIRIESGIIYPHPKYIAVRDCEGMLLITEKDLINKT